MFGTLKVTRATNKNMADFIPLTTYDYKVAFCQVTGTLPNEIQQVIWQKVISGSPPPTPPKAPIKPSRRLQNRMNAWKARRVI